MKDGVVIASSDAKTPFISIDNLKTAQLVVTKLLSILCYHYYSKNDCGLHTLKILYVGVFQ
jgi:hypothetical protein